jgi:hypothetical protein
LQKLGLERKISWALSMCSHCWIFLKIQFWKCENKECVHTWADGTGYTSRS